MESNLYNEDQFKQTFLNRLLEIVYALHTGISTNVWVLQSFCPFYFFKSHGICFTRSKLF